MFGPSPVLEYVVVAVPVLETIVFHVVPPSADLSILYPVIRDPPLFDGADHERFICDDDTAVASRFCGAEGAVGGGVVPVE